MGPSQISLYLFPLFLGPIYAPSALGQSPTSGCDGEQKDTSSCCPSGSLGVTLLLARSLGRGELISLLPSTHNWRQNFCLH